MLVGKLLFGKTLFRLLISPAMIVYRLLYVIVFGYVTF